MHGRAPRRLLQLALRVSDAQHWARVRRETNLDNGLFVVPPAAAETNRCREDDRASYKDTHGIPRPFVRCFSRHEL